MRSIIHLLSLARYGRSIVLPQFTVDRSVVGIGLSDWLGYAEPLARIFNYTNTYFHQLLFLTLPNPLAIAPGHAIL